jgi:hypothetical protein
MSFISTHYTLSPLISLTDIWPQTLLFFFSLFFFHPTDCAEGRHGQTALRSGGLVGRHKLRGDGVVGRCKRRSSGGAKRRGPKKVFCEAKAAPKSQAKRTHIALLVFFLERYDSLCCLDEWMEWSNLGMRESDRENTFIFGHEQITLELWCFTPYLLYMHVWSVHVDLTAINKCL